jgi:formiminoglutamase
MLQACMQPIPAALVQGLKEGSMGMALRKNQPEFPHLEGVRLALIGVGKGADAVRQQLYPLQWHFGSLKMADLGNLRPGNDGAATAAGLAEVLSELHELQITAVVIGDDALLRSAQYLALRHASTPIEFAMVLPGLDPESDAGLQRILQHQPSFLFNLSFYATQAYFMPETAMDWLEAGHYEHHRLGVLREKIEEAEPGLRSTHVMSVDLAALRYSDAPDLPMVSANGLYAEEAVALTRYAGLSPNLQSFLLYGSPFEHVVSASLAAQMAWYFVSGYTQRYPEQPSENDPNFMVYRTMMSNTVNEITFYRSQRSNRWWMEVPHPYEDRTVLLGCSYADYQKACDDDLPDRWWRAYQRML